MIIGIDLGTSTSEVSVFRNGKPEFLREIQNAPGGILPSVVGIGSRGDLIVGADAAALLIPKPEFAVQEVKRKMGTAGKITLGLEEFTPQEISAIILRHLKNEAERFLGVPVTEAVITVPAYFSDDARRATEDAGEMAGLKVRRLINEPTAAALAYGLERPGVEEKVLVYDLGGGTLDVTLLELSEGILDVLASAGNTTLGGKDFDERVMSHIAASCRRQTGVELLTTARHRQRLKVEAKRAKEALSTAGSVLISLDNIALDAEGLPVHFEMELDRDAFDGLIKDLLESTRSQLDEVLAAKAVDRSEVNTILMVGGSTRIPAVRDFVSGYFGGKQFRTDVGPDEAVSLGAAILAGIEMDQLSTDSLVITDVCPYSLGVAVSQEADGEYIDDYFSVLIEKQSTIPRTERKVYSTMHDFQEFVHVRVFQGDSTLCVDNIAGPEFLHPMKPAPAGAKVEVEFSYNLNGTVEVRAKDLQTGSVTKMKFSPGPTRLSDEARDASRRRLEGRWNAGPSPLATEPDSANAPQNDDSPTVAPWESSPLWPSVSALHHHARGRAESLEGSEQRSIGELVDKLQRCCVAGDDAALRRVEVELTNLLFDLD